MPIQELSSDAQMGPVGQVSQPALSLSRTLR